MSTPASSKRSALDGGAELSPASAGTTNNLDTSNNKRFKTAAAAAARDVSSKTTTNPTKPVTILTYEVVGSGVSVQVLRSNTIHDLVDAVCKETCVGLNESVYDHMWNVTDSIDGATYESGDIECTSYLRAENTKFGSIAGSNAVGSNLLLTYDYGSTSYVQLVLKSVEEDMLPDAAAALSRFPRREPLPGQATFVPYSPVPDAPNMDELYPDLSYFLFQKPDDRLEVCLFQPGKKKVQAFIEVGYDGLCHMMHVPEKFGSVEEMLYALNESCTSDTPPYHNNEFPLNNWFGASIFPLADQQTPTPRFKKYSVSQCDGLDITVARGYDGDEEKAATYSTKFFKTFPKSAAAAGFNQKGKPSKSTERGWIVYHNGTLTVCRGDSKKIKSNAPSPGVFDGQNKHEPENDAVVVGKINIRVKSLHELFCAAEALW